MSALTSLRSVLTSPRKASTSALVATWPNDRGQGVVEFINEILGLVVGHAMLSQAVSEPERVEDRYREGPFEKRDPRGPAAPCHVWNDLRP